MRAGSIWTNGHSKNGRARHAYLSPGTIVMLRAQRARVEMLQQELGRINPLQPSQG